MKPLYRLIIVLIVFPLSLKAQEYKERIGDFIYGLSAGFNYSSLYLDSERKKSTARPFIGLYGSYLIRENWRLKGNGLLAIKASELSAQNNIRQIGFDLSAYPQYKWDDLYFNLGLNLDVPVSSGIQSVGSGSTKVIDKDKRETYQLNKTQLNFLLGFEIQIVDNWKLGANFILPARSNHQRNFQLSLNFQINKRPPRAESARKIRNRIAKRQIKQLKNGALLVRLKTSIPKIKALKKVGFVERAKKTKKEQKTENLSLMQAMKAYYDFSELRFFYSYHSKNVRQNKFEGIFLNDSLEEDSSIVLHNKKNIFTAEFAQLEEDTSKFFSHYEWVQTGHFAFVKRPVFYGGGGHTFMALVIKDDEFNQLHRPFPYYSRAAYLARKEHPGHGFFFLPVFLFSPGSIKETVINFNQKLHRFYEKNYD